MFQFQKFRPITGTTNTPHYNVVKFLSNLLNPLTLNDYALRVSFEAVDTIKAIPEHLFSEEYRYVSLDIESLFTNVPLKKTVNIILKRVYGDNQIQTFLFQTHIEKTYPRFLHQNNIFF